MSIRMDDLISVIVPVYNGEAYIGTCIRSLLRQSYTNIEIIIVNDGSTDGTAQRIREAAGGDPRVSVFLLENRGVSAARNYGLAKAKGQWIAFVDGDDFVDAKMLETAMRFHRLCPFDIFCMNGIYTKDGGLTEMRELLPRERLYTGGEIQELMTGLYCPRPDRHYGDYFRAVWGKLFSAEIVKGQDLRFPENIKIGEDSLFLLDCFAAAQRVLIADEKRYFYRLHSASAVGRYKKNFEKNQIAEFTEMKARFDKYGLDATDAAIAFWHGAEKDFLENELKSQQGLWNAAKKLKLFASHPTAKQYLKQFAKGESVKGKIRTLLFRCRLYWIIGLTDAWLLSKKRSTQ